METSKLLSKEQKIFFSEKNLNLTKELGTIDDCIRLFSNLTTPEFLEMSSTIKLKNGEETHFYPANFSSGREFKSGEDSNLVYADASPLVFNQVHLTKSLQKMFDFDMTKTTLKDDQLIFTLSLKFLFINISGKIYPSITSTTLHTHPNLRRKGLTLWYFKKAPELVKNKVSQSIIPTLYWGLVTGEVPELHNVELNYFMFWHKSESLVVSSPIENEDTFAKLKLIKSICYEKAKQCDYKFALLNEFEWMKKPLKHCDKNCWNFDKINLLKDIKLAFLKAKFDAKKPDVPFWDYNWESIQEISKQYPTLVGFHKGQIMGFCVITLYETLHEDNKCQKNASLVFCDVFAGDVSTFTMCLNAFLGERLDLDMFGIPQSFIFKKVQFPSLGFFNINTKKQLNISFRVINPENDNENELGNLMKSFKSFSDLHLPVI